MLAARRFFGRPRHHNIARPESAFLGVPAIGPSRLLAMIRPAPPRATGIVLPATGVLVYKSQPRAWIRGAGRAEPWTAAKRPINIDLFGISILNNCFELIHATRMVPFFYRREIAILAHKIIQGTFI